MKNYKNNLEGLDKLREILDLQLNLIQTQETNLRMILKNIESNKDEEVLKEIKKGTDSEAISVGEFADILRIKGVPFGRNKVHSWLNNRGYTFRMNNKNYAKYEFIDSGLFKVKTYIVNTVEGPIEVETIYITAKGVMHFKKEIFKEFNIRES